MTGRSGIFVISGWVVLLIGAQAVSQERAPSRAPAPRPSAAPAPAARTSPEAAPEREAPRVAQVPQARAVPGPPQGFPLSPDQQQRVDAILRFWEFHTSQIKTFQCKFTRQTYNFVFGPKDAPFTVDRGSLRYAAPDKGLMRVDEVFAFNPQATSEADRYQKQDVQFGEYWVCDGESIYQFDSRTKTLNETRLPPEMQGQSIGDGPLPFLFGAKADTMKSRYWIREITPSGNTGVEYWLEAIPKKAEDAANFDKLLVQLEKPKARGEQLVPKAMKLFKKEGFVIYSFSDPMANDPRHLVAGFLHSFVRPSTPLGWKKVVEDWSQPPVEAAIPGGDRPADPRLGDTDTTPPTKR